MVVDPDGTAHMPLVLDTVLVWVLMLKWDMV